jgi:hypothetical protein
VGGLSHCTESNRPDGPKSCHSGKHLAGIVADPALVGRRVGGLGEPVARLGVAATRGPLVLGIEPVGAGGRPDVERLVEMLLGGVPMPGVHGELGHHHLGHQMAGRSFSSRPQRVSRSTAVSPGTSSA